MLKTLRIFLLVVSTFCCTSTFSQTDIFVKINGINGTSVASGFTAYSEVELSGLANTTCYTSGNGGNACQGTPGNFNFQMKLNEVAPQLQAKLFAGSVITTVDFVYRKISGATTPFVYYQIHLEGVRIASIAEVANSGSSIPTEQYALAFQKIAWKYTAQAANGGAGTSTIGCWNFLTNSGGTNNCSYTFPF